MSSRHSASPGEPARRILRPDQRASTQTVAAATRATRPVLRRRRRLVFPRSHCVDSAELTPPWKPIVAQVGACLLRRPDDGAAHGGGGGGQQRLRRLSACSLAGLGKVFDEQARLAVLSASRSPAEEPSSSLRRARAWWRPRQIGGSSANSSARPASEPVDHVLPSNASRLCGASAAELTASRPSTRPPTMLVLQLARGRNYRW